MPLFTQYNTYQMLHEIENKKINDNKNFILLNYI